MIVMPREFVLSLLSVRQQIEELKACASEGTQSAQTTISESSTCLPVQLAPPQGLSWQAHSWRPKTRR